jgi:hypothetical protein
MANKFTDAVFECDVKGTDKLLLFILGGFADNEKGECWPSYKTLAKRAGLGYSTIQDSLKRLIGVGFVSVVGRRQIRDTDQYTLILRLNLEKLQEHVLASTTSGNHYQSEPGTMHRERGQHVPGTGKHVPGSTDELNMNSLYNSLDALTIAIDEHSATQEGQEQEPAGETPATPVFSSKCDSRCEGESDWTNSGSGEPVSSNPAPTHDYDALPRREFEPARWLANYLYCFLSVREDVEVLPGWEKFWTKDFEDALDSGWSVEDVTRAVRASQVGRAREFYKRGASIVANLELLAENGQKLESKDLLCEYECPKCHGLFIGVEALIEHQLGCYEKPVDPEDAAEEEAMDLADELVSEGYVREHPEMATYYPWGDDDRQMVDPWAEVPEQLPELTGEQMPY